MQIPSLLDYLSTSQNDEHARQLAEVMRVADAYAKAYSERAAHQNQNSRREQQRKRNALVTVVSNLLFAVKEKQP